VNLIWKLAPAVVILALAGCGGKSAPAPETPLASAVASAAPTLTLNPRQQFILSYRQALAAEGQGTGASDAQLYRLGKLVCRARANGESQSVLMGIGGNATVLNKLAEKNLCPQYR
jgi:hypothetical protein